MLLLASAGALRAQYNGDVLGQHQLSLNSGSPITGKISGCAYCHVPHSGLGGSTPLWNQKLSTVTYVPYTSSTYHEKGNPNPASGAPNISNSSSLCLSCHDGTVAPGQTVLYGNMPMFGKMDPADLIGANVNGQYPLQSDHPFSLILPFQDSPDLFASLASHGTTNDPTGAVSLIRGNVECNSCHNPHVQNKDTISQKFLVRDDSSGAICLQCHDINRSYSSQGNASLWQKNPLAGWQNSAHALSTNKLDPSLKIGNYSTVATNACLSCHAPHNAPGPVELTRAPNEQDCLNCHTKNGIGPDIQSEYNNAGNVGHPFPQGTNSHDAVEDLLSTKVVLNGNRHATCVDCHNSHAAQPVTSFSGLAAPPIRVSQASISGLNSDGLHVMNPAVNQYENCLRCHGPSAGKAANAQFGYFPKRAVAAADWLNVINEFSSLDSSHPVFSAPGSNALPQPSLRGNMLQLDGVTQGRIMGTQIFCTDCHNNDSNREFGGNSPNGPHGSQYPHILERAYPFTQPGIGTWAPGDPIPAAYLYTPPILTPQGTYAMCAKCHDLTQLNASWNQHLPHVNQGFSCSVCHTAHGMGAKVSSISGQRLVNFDVNVVGQNGSTPITYNYIPGADTCTLACHGYLHSPSGVVPAAVRRPVKSVIPRK